MSLRVVPVRALSASLGLAALVLFAAWTAPLSAAPNISNVSLRGLRIGGTTTLVIDGTELLPAPQLILPWPTATQVVHPNATPQRLVVDVTLPADIAPGIYSLRLASGSGVSNVVPVGADRLEQKPWPSEPVTLPIALHGSLSGEQRLRASFSGRQGQALAVDVECQRLGATVRPVVRLFDARGVQLAWSPPRFDLAGDARLAVNLPSDGVYTVEIHDLVYRGAAPGFMRVKLGDFSWATQVYPTGVTRGAQTTIESRGELLSPSFRTTVAASDAVVEQIPVAPPSDRIFSGHLPSVAVSNFAEVSEPASGASAGSTPAALGRPPLAISGRLAAKGEDDRLALDVTPGSQLQFEVFARRIGSPVDAVLTILGPQGNGLASADDRPGTPDPLLDFTVPANVERISVSVRDMQGRGGDEFVYRVVVRDLSRPDVTISLPFDRLNIPAGSTQLIPLTVTRQSHAGPIQLEWIDAGVPGLTWQGLVIAPGATQGLLSVTASADAAPKASVGRLIAKGGEGESVFVREAQLPDGPLHRLRPWSRSELALSTAVAGPIALDWVADGADETLPLGWQMTRKLAIRRSQPGNGTVRLKLVSTQPMPKKTVKQNNQDVQVDDVDRALRLQGEPSIAADQQEGLVTVLVPADLPPGPWSLAVVAELLAGDGKTVVATTATPVKTLPTRAQLTLQVTSSATLIGKAGGGDAGKVEGKVVRVTGWEAPVTLSLVGLPEGVTSPQVVVPPGQSDFALPLNFAAGTKVGELKGLRVIATAPFDAQQPAGLVRSNEVTVNVNVTPGN